MIHPRRKRPCLWCSMAMRIDGEPTSTSALRNWSVESITHSIPRICTLGKKALLAVRLLSDGRKRRALVNLTGVECGSEINVKLAPFCGHLVPFEIILMTSYILQSSRYFFHTKINPGVVNLDGNCTSCESAFSNVRV